MSIKEIAALLAVSRGSVSIWVRDIELSPKQLAALAARNPALNGQRVGQQVRAARALAQRQSYQAQGRELARKEGLEFAAGCMLFWAEGSRSRNSVRFTNSDPEMMAFFMCFLRRYFAVTDDMVAVWCNLFADHIADQERIEQFWLDTLALPRSSLGKSTVNVYSRHSKGLRRNKLPYGTCRITVSRTRIVQALYGAIQEFGGFEREEWLTM
jgi:hypothetical protein